MADHARFVLLVRGAAYAPPIESSNTKKEILGVVAREKSTSRLVNPWHPGGGGNETTKREAEPLAKTTYARDSRAVS